LMNVIDRFVYSFDFVRSFGIYMNLSCVGFGTYLFFFSRPNGFDTLVVSSKSSDPLVDRNVLSPVVAVEGRMVAHVEHIGSSWELESVVT